MKISALTGALKGRTDAIAVCLFEDELKSPKLSGLDRRTVSAFQKLIAASRFSGKHSETTVHFSDGAQAPVLVLQGLGSRRDFTWHRLRQSAGAVIRAAKSNEVGTLSIFSSEQFASDLSAENTARALTDAVVLGHWGFEHYKSKKKGHAVSQVSLYFGTSARQKAATAVIPQAQILAEAHNLAREYGTHPANVVTTDYLKAEAKKLARFGIKVTVLERAQLEKLGMNLILAVGQASVMPPRVIIMDYAPRAAKKTVAFVGKGLVFDNGGLNIKVAKMEEMKSDMCGAAAVLGAMHAVANLKPKQRVLGVIGACENAIGGNAFRPSDVYTAYNGKTVEIGNTDAEGRLVLADTMAYVVDKYKPNLMVDIATLTGAAKIALGNHADAVFSNSEHVSKQILDSAERAFERMWPMPLYEEYGDEMKSTTAMLNNAGKDRWGGACRAAAFLKEFVGTTPWAHIDIAPTSFPAVTNSLNPPRTANGSATKTLIELAMGA
ncbi:MAG: leucyl aminopeptidase [Calditrichaeota bacterium]|nr:leucyl aminopeptidase [Calditrichota bacterium]